MRRGETGDSGARGGGVEEEYKRVEDEEKVGSPPVNFTVKSVRMACDQTCDQTREVTRVGLPESCTVWRALLCLMLLTMLDCLPSTASPRLCFFFAIDRLACDEADNPVFFLSFPLTCLKSLSLSKPLSNLYSDESSSDSDPDSDSENNAPPAPPSTSKSLSTFKSPYKSDPAADSFISELKDTAVVLPSTKKVYSIINTFTGRIGGNGAGGPIYGELTIKSMQKMVQMMKSHQDLTADSRFIDVGAGLGKPNFHVAADPGCELSYGIECEETRWRLSMANLRPVLKEVRVVTTSILVVV